jgi:hypothetical protein
MCSLLFALVSLFQPRIVRAHDIVLNPYYQAAIDSFLYLPALVLPAIKSYKGYLAPLAWAFSYLWLVAFVFAAQDYEYGSCALRSPYLVNKCSLKRTLEAFAFIAL